MQNIELVIFVFWQLQGKSKIVATAECRTICTNCKASQETPKCSWVKNTCWVTS